MNQSATTARLRLEDQVAVVTGGTRGIGEGIVRRFVEEGAKVVFSGRSSEKGKALEEELRPNLAFYRADVASAPETEGLMRFTVERFGRLDCVVNNAGAGGEGDRSQRLPLRDSSDRSRCYFSAHFLGSNMLSHT
jgi:NAD(P)-dependent dehydrogenase (short-subunit alcohol dehydrogenase family)